MSAALYARAMGVIAEWQTVGPALSAELQERNPELAAALDDLVAQYLREYADRPHDCR